MRALARADRGTRRRRDLRPGGRRARPDGRGGRAAPRHVGRRPGGDRDRPAKPIPCEVVGFSGGNALLMPFAPLEGVRRGCRAVVSAVRGRGAAVAGLARPGGQRHGRADRRQGPAAVGPAALSVPRAAAAGPCPPAGRRADRPRRARAQHLRHLLPRPAHGHLLRLRRRQVGAAVDAGAQRRRRRLGDRADRRARPRGAGIPAGRSRRGRAWPARSWWWRPPTSRR